MDKIQMARAFATEITIATGYCPGNEDDHHQSVRIVESMLTDSSKVYAVLVGNVRIDCVDYRTAHYLYVKLTITGQCIIDVTNGR